MKIRPRFQFSLRAFLLLMILGCLGLGRWVESARRQRDAVDAVLRAGGRVTYDYVPGECGPTDIIKVKRIEQHGFWLDFVHNPACIYAARSDEGDAIISQLKHLPTITDVEIPGCHVTAAGLSELKYWRNPRILMLDQTDITDAELKFVGQLHGLILLGLHRTEITDDGLRHLTKLQKLTGLWIYESRTTRAGSTAVGAALPNCIIDWR